MPRVRGSSPLGNRSPQTFKGISRPDTIEALNTTGDRLQPFTVISLVSNSDPNGIAVIQYPATGDDPEASLYGVTVEDIMDGQVGHVQISGMAYVQTYQDADVTFIDIGDILYALDNTDSTRGLASSKSSGAPGIISNNPIGRALEAQVDFSVLLRINLNVSGGSSTTYIARLQLSDPAGLLSTLYSIDGETPDENDIIFVNQDLDTDGLYYAGAGIWKVLSLLSDLTDGSQINVWDGNSAPLIYITGS